MTESEFETNYCLLCGTQRCGGVHDEIFREGCSHYQKEMLGKQTLHEMLEEVNRLYRKVKGERTMTCKDCIHENVCSNLYPQGLLPCKSDKYPADKFCLEFKNKADFVEVKHGYWIEYPSEAHMKCSICGMEYHKSRMPRITAYCPNPNCGARMDGERKETNDL